jgi:PAS domain S-box-containing protein
MIVLLLVFAFTLSMQQKNTYKSLWMAQQEFETTLYSIGDGVITTDEQGRVKNLNKVAEELTGWIERDAINKPISGIFNIINEDTLKPVESPVNKVIEKGQIVGLANHALLISKDGSRIPIADSGAPIVNSEGEIVGVVLVFRDQTEERDHQMILEEQRRQLFTLLSNLPGMAYRCKCNKDWTMELVSKGCINLTGYNEDELNENKIVSYGQLIIEDDRDFVWEQVQNALNTRTNFEFEYRIRTKSNSIKWVWEKGQGIYDEEGNLIALEGFINDIDERKKIESALKKSEQLFQNLTENATVGIFKTDKEGLTTYINPEWKNITGLTYSEAKGNGWLNYVHPDDKNTIAENWNYSIDKNKKSDAEYRFVKTNGEIVWVKGQAVPEYDGHHNLVGYIGTINNITDIKAYENKLKEANTLLHALIDNIPDAIYLKDIQGRKVLVNKADLINIGIDDEKDVLGKSDFDVFPKEIAEEFWKVDQEVMNKGEALLDVEEELINNNNERKWLSTSKIPYKNDKNERIGLIGIGHDISYKKKLHEELVYAKNKAEESDQLKTSFLANMSHEIRTPLNSILGFTNLITESDDLNKNERTEYSTIIQKSSDSLLQIINDIIDISSLETGQLAINNSEVKVNNIVNMLEIEYSRRVSDLKIKDIEIKSLIVDEDLSMITDSNRLNQIFINLLTNALKFTSSGSIVFGIEKYDKKKVYFKVQDTGIGIEPHSQKIIFDRFRQAENNNVRKFGGNGLGLSIVNNLVELMGGNISLESELGKGSVFRFNLPFNPPQ